MTNRIIGVLVILILLAGAQTPSTQAATPLTITMKVTAQGLVASGVPMQDKRMTIPRGTRVRLVLSYADSNHNAHKFTVTAKDTEITSPVIDGETRKTSTIEFTAEIGVRNSIAYPASFLASPWMS